MILQILNTLFFISFLGFAYVNLNDKDSFLWVPIYVIAAVLCGWAVVGTVYPTLNLIMMGLYLIYAVWLFFTKDGVWDWFTRYDRQSLVETMQAKKPYIEKAREFFGLLIITAALAINYFSVV